VTFAAWSEDQAYRPFKKTYKLYVSSLPYDVDISGGQSVTDYFNNSTGLDSTIKRLKTLRPASLQFLGSRLRTNASNSVMVTVSVLGQQKWSSWWQLLSRAFSVSVFVTGTAFFASVTLLSLVIAVVVLTATLVAGIFGRAIVSGIVGSVADVEPVIHVISSNEDEAHRAIAEILSLKADDGSTFQVEIRGQIIINGRRVAHRWRWPVLIFGVLADPHDIAGPYRKDTHTSVGTGTPMSMLSPQLTNASMGGSLLTPFLSSATNQTLPLFQRIDSSGAIKSVAQETTKSVHSNGNNTDSGSSFQIARRPVPSSEPEQ
jgi:hypothetical protein